MQYAALALAVLALVAALIAMSKARAASRAIVDSHADARRRAENMAAEAEEKLDKLRRALSQMAAGKKLTPEMILEGQLWRETPTADGVRMVTSGSVRVLDVRTPRETAGGIIPGALLIPIDQLEERWRELPKDDKPMLVVCAGGERSAAACEFLSQQGYQELYNLLGGMLAWNGPTARAK